MSNSIAMGVAYDDPQFNTSLTAVTNVKLGSAAANTVGFYGKTPASQRSSSVQTSSNLATSTSFGATQLAWANEVTATLVGLGIWKGS